MSEIRRITDIQIQQKRKSRVSVFLDGEFAFGLDQDVLIKSGIAQGDELDEKQIAEIIRLEELKQAKEKGVRLLAVRARSKKELSDRFRQSKISAKVIEEVLAEFERLNLLNDTEFAIMFARNRMITKPVGNRMLRNELRTKGLNEQDIEKGVQAAYDETSEYEFAYQVALKAKKRYRSHEDDKAKKKSTDFLLRRGFTWDIVSDIMENWEQLDIE